MKAIVQHEYGQPENVLELQDIEQPPIGDDDVLVRVRAASIHIGDCHLMKGIPYFLRLGFGLSKPKYSVPGTDIAGEIEAVGGNVTRLQPGDEVFGWCKGAFAEYASAPETNFVTKPADLPFEPASTVVTSAATALHALRDHGQVESGQTVLINGASGGVGTFAVQVAKSLGAEVTGVCSTRNVEMVRSIGADHVIDYTQEDFTQGAQRYDLIMDNVANHSSSRLRSVLTPDGKLQPNGATPGPWLGGLDRIIPTFVTSMFVSQQGRPFVLLPKTDDLVDLKKLVESGDLTPVVERTYPLSEAPDALGYVAAGHARAKVVIAM